MFDAGLDQHGVCNCMKQGSERTETTGARDRVEPTRSISVRLARFIQHGASNCMMQED